MIPVPWRRLTVIGITLLLLFTASFPTARAASLRDLSGQGGSLTERLGGLLDDLDTGQNEKNVTSPVDRARESSESQDSDLLSRLSQLSRPSQAPPSTLERDFSYRAGQSLRQFGYDLFRASFSHNTPLVGAIGDDYIMGVGDEMVITFFGQNPNTVTTRVDREGRIVLTNILPVTAVGRPFGEVRAEIEERVRSGMVGTRVFVSIGRMRSINIMVVGEVEKPGMHRLTGLSTFLEALTKAGGIKKTGSLRQITINRQDTTITLDLYTLLINGTLPEHMTIMEGDRIHVPPIGPTVAVAGDVKRPAIFEITDTRDATVLLQWAGGALRPRGNRYVHISLDDQGGERVTEHTAMSGLRLRDGDLFLSRWAEKPHRGSVYLTGHVRVPGLRSIEQAKTVGQLVGNIENLKTDPYLPFAALVTTNPQTHSRELSAVNLQETLEGKSDRPLKDDDILVVFNNEDIRFLSSYNVQSVLMGSNEKVFTLITELSKKKEKKADTIAEEDLTQEMGQQDGLSTVPGSSRNKRRAAMEGLSGLEGMGNAQVINGEMVLLLPEEGNEPSRMLVNNDRPFEKGKSQHPGLGKACNGLMELAHMRMRDLSNRFTMALQLFPGEQSLGVNEDLSTCPPVFDQFPQLLPFALEYAIALNGEVRRPGIYPAVQNTRLSDLIGVAGGFTREADLAHVELSRYTMKGDQVTAREQLDMTRAHPAEVRVNPGDALRFNPLYSDRDTGTIRLSGEFMRPGVFEIRRGETLSEVITRAGGITPQAYPFGAVFSRLAVKEAEKRAFQKTARELQMVVSTTAIRPGQSGQAATNALGAINQLAKTLQETEPVGRVVVEADPAVLQVRPELDVILEPGDHVHMPKRPNFVTVTGEVLNASSLSFVPDSDPEYYIRLAGGTRQSADEERVFMIKPNGAAQPMQRAMWNFTPMNVTPGSTIVVPLDATPFDTMTFTVNISQILSQLAITMASMATLNN